MTLRPGEPVARLETRLRMEPDGRVTAFSGKVEFGQGIRTAFAKIVAAELGVPVDRVTVVLGDTAQVPFDRGTFGSRSIAEDGELLRRAAALARELIAEGRPLEGPIPEDMPVTTRPLDVTPRRIEAPEIVTGRARFVADVRLPGMLRGAIARPPVRGARPASVDDGTARAMAGVVMVVRDADLVGVVAERQAQAVAAAQALDIEWTMPAVAEQDSVAIPINEDGATSAALAGAATRIAATYVMPYISNAPIGPSASVADVRTDGATVYAGTQRPFGLRDEVAAATGLAVDTVRVIALMPSGTYGRNSLGDAAIEAARLSQACGRPVLLQWSREEEFAHGPARPACALDIEAGTDAEGRFVGWRYDEHTNAHGYGGIDKRIAPFTSGRNAVPPYRVPHLAVTLHIEPSLLRTASFRSLAAAENVFAIESLVDEIAFARGEDPLELRLRNTSDPRLRAVLEAVALRSGWRERTGGEGRGLGLACTLYAHGTYVAQVAEVTVGSNGRVRLGRFWCAVDPGRVIDPNGVRNQCEGAIVQSASWTLLEELKQRDGRVASTGWDTYPIATFRDTPTEIDIQLMGAAGEPPTGVGEPPGVPVAAAIANAVFAASGARVRDLPITADRVRAARR
ncbi:MAG TPA: molybdopterin cofactor-binding domain-containing protein [Candidatus Limnocylindria bacterium]